MCGNQENSGEASDGRAEGGGEVRQSILQGYLVRSHGAGPRRMEAEENEMGWTGVRGYAWGSQCLGGLSLVSDLCGRTARVTKELCSVFPAHLECFLRCQEQPGT